MARNESIRHQILEDLGALSRRAFYACCDFEGRSREDRQTCWSLMIKCMDAMHHFCQTSSNGEKRYERDVEEICELAQRIKEQESNLDDEVNDIKEWLKQKEKNG